MVSIFTMEEGAFAHPAAAAATLPFGEGK